MKNLIKLLAFTAVLFTLSCRTVKKTTHEENSSEKIIANQSRDSSVVSSLDSTGSQEATYDFDEETTVEFPPGYNYHFNPDHLIPDTFPAGTKITTRKKGKIQTKDTSAKKQINAFSNKSNATGEVIRTFQKKDSSKKVSAFPIIPVVIGAIVLIIAMLLLKRFGLMPSLFKDLEELNPKNVQSNS